MKKVLWMVLLATAFAVPDRSLAQWVQTGGPLGGYINSIAEDDSFFYAATFGPVFRMQKNDTTWTPLGRGASCLTVMGTTLVAGTSGGGVFHSTDHGMTWERWTTGLNQAEGINAFAVSGDSLFAGTNRGVYLSMDHGSTWSPSNAGQDSLPVLSLLVKDTTLFAGTLAGGVYRSTDHGASWVSVNNGVLTDSVWVWSVVTIDSAIFAATWWSDGIYRSTDNGTTWIPVSNGLLNRDVQTLAVIGKNLLAGTFGGVHLSTDRGDSWTYLDDGPPCVVNCFHGSGTDVLAGTMEGVYFTSETGDSWNTVNEGLIGTVVSVVLRSGTALFAGTRDGGLFRSDDNGARWVKTALHSRSVTSLVASGTDLFAGTGGGVWHSSDGGSYWSWVNAGMQLGIAGLAVIPRGIGGEYLFAGTDTGGVFLSTNRGAIWTPVDSGLTERSIRCLATSGTDIFAGTGSGVFVSRDTGASWTSASVGLTDTTVLCLAASGGNLFAGTDEAGVFRSTDGGGSWKPASTGLTDLNILCLAASGKYVFAGVWGADRLFLSENNGDTWARVDTGLARYPLHSLHFSGTDLFAGMRGGGVWRRPLSEMITSVPLSSGEVPSGFTLEQNFPNPFNPGTTIRFSLPHKTGASLRVFDLLGREVALLVDQEMAAGTYKVPFDGKHLSSGVYYYRLQAGEYMQIRKFLLLR